MNTNQEETQVEAVEEVLCCCYEKIGDNDQCKIHGKDQTPNS